MIQNINRIDHVIYCVEPENLHRAAATFDELLDISLEGPFKMQDQGLEIYIDWDSGIEIMAPIEPRIAASQRQFLDEHGEGVFRICFGFKDRDLALKRAEAMGIPVTARFDVLELFPQWRDRFANALESTVGPVHGVRLNFCQIEPIEDLPESE